MNTTALFFGPAVALLLLAGCKSSSDTAKEAPPPQEPTPAVEAPRPPLTKEGQGNAPTPSPVAKIGEAAPGFTLQDLEGESFSLSSQRGKTIVLEWFNPQCPFVKASHTKGSLVTTASELMKKGVVYVAINSGAPGKQGHGVEVNAAGRAQFKLKHPVLLDETGKVGHAYEATNTPHIFVINGEGVLVYRGAVDNSPDGEGQSPEGGTLVNYLTQAVDEVLAGKPVSTPETKAYGCGVKYE